jgi:hypothetical protein
VRRLTITIRTADRHPRQNYLGQTVRGLIAAGVAAEQIHVFPTAPDVRWLDVELGDLPIVRHVPSTRRDANANGVAQVAALDVAPADWLLMLEDDVHVCADFEGSVLRWLDRFARPDVHVYRFCAFGEPEHRLPSVTVHPLREQRGSQAVALRSDDARRFAAWWSTHETDWRPKHAPFQQEPGGFDKLIGYWALAEWPETRYGLVSRPQFVHHVGMQSSLHSRGVRNDEAFAGTSYRFEARA